MSDISTVLEELFHYGLFALAILGLWLACQSNGKGGPPSDPPVNGL